MNQPWLGMGMKRLWNTLQSLWLWGRKANERVRNRLPPLTFICLIGAEIREPDTGKPGSRTRQNPQAGRIFSFRWIIHISGTGSEPNPALR